jgi:alpha-glucosidase
VIYQIYPRSFQDSDGDGIGDLPGVTGRLGHLEWLGVDAIWLSPIYPSPLADMGYDVSDHTAVAAELGTLADFDALVEAAHRRGIRVLLDLIPSHTSIEHPWFREHPDWYVWSDDGPPNNWIASFGGPAWSRDERSGRWYLHSFYPEQPDLNWRVPAVREAFAEVVRFWLDRGVDGFRVDAVDRLLKDPGLRDDPPAREPFGLPLPAEYATLEHRHSTNAPDIGLALSALREAAGEALLIGEVYLPSERLAPYLEHFELVFSFEFLHAPFEAARIREVVATGVALERVAWVASNHDFGRLASRVAPRPEALAAMLLLTLPGGAFLYQGDEIGLVNGPGSEIPIDRAGRDPYRHPMQWSPDPLGGFTEGTPWLPLVDPASRNVADQHRATGSLLDLHRRLIALRRDLDPAFEMLDGGKDVIAYRRGRRVVALNFSAQARALPVRGGEVELSTLGTPANGGLRPNEGVVVIER